MTATPILHELDVRASLAGSGLLGFALPQKLGMLVSRGGSRTVRPARLAHIGMVVAANGVGALLAIAAHLRWSYLAPGAAGRFRRRGRPVRPAGLGLAHVVR
jgi:hypothetical protein